MTIPHYNPYDASTGGLSFLCFNCSPFEKIHVKYEAKL